MALIAIPGDPNANAYDDVAGADAYFAQHPFATTWVTATTGAKEAGLIVATQRIDAYFRWLGRATTSTQALGFPRTGLTLNGWPVPSDVIPRQLKAATDEYAQLLLTADSELISDVAAQGITRVKAGSLELQFRDDMRSVRRLIPGVVIGLIPPEWYEGGIVDNGDGSEDTTKTALFEVIE